MSQADDSGGKRLCAMGLDGARTPIEGTAVVAAFGDGRELRIAFAESPSIDGCVHLRSEFVAPGTNPQPLVPGHLPDVWTSILIRPGGGNLMQIAVEARARKDHSIVAAADERAPSATFFAVTSHGRARLDAPVVVLDLGGRRELIASVAVGRPTPDRPLPSRPGHVALYASAAMTTEEIRRKAAGGEFASAGFWVRFGGANVVDLVVQRQDSVRAIRTTDDLVAAAVMQWRRLADDHARGRLLELTAFAGPEVVDALLLRMSGDDADVRAAANEMLRQITAQDFGFDRGASADERAAAVMRWRAWRSEAGSRLVYDAAAKRLVVR